MVTARVYPRPSPGAAMGSFTWWDRYVRSCITRGDGDPASQAAWGRYYAAKGTALPQKASMVAHKAHARATDQPGLLNRRVRRWIQEKGQTQA